MNLHFRDPDLPLFSVDQLFQLLILCWLVCGHSRHRSSPPLKNSIIEVVVPK
ncbi:hypothetical protein D1114_23125 [Cereibacter sphaeroides]|uniref:Uncharacterized protein n=1 Tax=Cereibacter sphaeroides TaxID=1063 RepID=A0AAX1UEV7_CERSP|nr:hypothetical protein D1114_23125 [Cereibacter sphaeroides]